MGTWNRVEWSANNKKCIFEGVLKVFQISAIPLQTLARGRRDRKCELYALILFECKVNYAKK